MKKPKLKRSLTAESVKKLTKAGKINFKSKNGSRGRTGQKVAPKPKTFFGSIKSKTSSQIAAAKRNIAKAQQAAKRKAGGTSALRAKKKVGSLVNKVKRLF